MYESPITVHTIADLMRANKDQYEKGFIDGKSFYENRTCSKCRFFVDDFFMNGEMSVIIGHEICLFWGRGCKTNPNAFCSYFEDKTDETLSK